MGKLGMFLFFVCLVAGLYLLNSSLNLITLPPVITGFNKTIDIIGGLLIIIGGFFMMKLGKKKVPGQTPAR